MSENNLMAIDGIQNRIYTIRGVQVMLDNDLAQFYGTETKLLNRAVKRNRERFPEEFMFQLTEYKYGGIRSQLLILNDSENLRFQNGTSSGHGDRISQKICRMSSNLLCQALKRSRRN
jgi:hypothetical protein